MTAGSGYERVFHDDPQGTGEVVCADDGGLFEIVPEARVGDRVELLVGVLNYRLGIYCMQLISQPELKPKDLLIDQTPSTLTAADFFRIATFNLEELFDPYDDPLTEDAVLSETEYHRRLQKRALAIADELGHPAVLAVQEAENTAVVQELVDRAELQAHYDFVIQEGLDVRGLDVALIYRPDLVSILDSRSVQGCTALVDGFEPDGNNDPQNPQNELTCDQNGDGELDGNRLFSRPPLVVHLWARPAGIQNSPASANALQTFFDFYVVVIHFKSKVGDTSTAAYTLPRRLEQAHFVAQLVASLRESHPFANLVVLGDFNDYPTSPALITLKNTGLLSAMSGVERFERYTYNYRGISQVLDDILFIPQELLAPGAVEAVHINSDFPYSFMGEIYSSHRSSDHDPVVADFIPILTSNYLPIVNR